MSKATLLNYTNQIVNKEVKMNWREIVLNVVKTALLMAILLFTLVMCQAYEEHQLCLNGATEHCIEEDFK